jgi:hypothetical protein
MGKKATTLEGHVSGQCNKPMSLPAHSLTLEQVKTELKTEEWHGLDDAEAKRRVDEYGSNELGEAESVSPVKILIAQVANAMTLVLIMAMAVSFGIKSWIEGGVVAFVIGLNIVVGFFQEWSAEKTMDSLRSLSSPTARLIRSGQQVSLRSRLETPSLPILGFLTQSTSRLTKPYLPESPFLFASKRTLPLMRRLALVIALTSPTVRPRSPRAEPRESFSRLAPTLRLAPSLLNSVRPSRKFDQSSERRTERQSHIVTSRLTHLPLPTLSVAFWVST